MLRIAVGAVVAPAVALGVYGVLAFAGILMTTLGKQSAPSDAWIHFGSFAVGGFLGACCWGAITGRFSRRQMLLLMGCQAVLFVFFVMPAVATGTYGVPIWLQAPIALTVIATTVAAGGWLGSWRRRKRPDA